MHDADHQSSAPPTEVATDHSQNLLLPSVMIAATRRRRNIDRKPPQEARRRRGGDNRSTVWGDQLLHSLCGRAINELPRTFPVEHHQGTATIPRAVVAQREGEVLFCTYSHCGPHVWPDGEEVSESQPDVELEIEIRK